VTKATLDRAIPPGSSIVIDSSVALAYLAGGEPGTPAATRVFDEFVSSGRNAAALSMVTVAEILVRPFRSSQAAVATAEGFLRHFGEIRLVDIDYAIAREAARIRATTNLRMPDALILATAVVVDADIVVTSDRAWPAAISSVDLELGVCFLDEHPQG
jgi:predicted nucleic acid-binding protein